MEKNKNRRIFEFHGKSKDREIRGREHNETQKKKRTGGTLRRSTRSSVRSRRGISGRGICGWSESKDLHLSVKPVTR